MAGKLSKFQTIGFQHWKGLTYKLSPCKIGKYR